MRMPKGTVGFRWQEQKGQWNIKMEDGLDHEPIDPELTFRNEHDEVVMVSFHEFAEGGVYERGVPVKYVATANGPVPVTTVYDLLMAQFGVSRGLPGDYPEDYDDERPYTPAWQERLTGIGRDTITRLAREFAGNAEKTE